MILETETVAQNVINTRNNEEKKKLSQISKII